MNDNLLSNRKGLINPENASLIIPIFSGFAISILVLIFGIIPKILLIKVSNSNINTLKEKVSFIPLLELRVQKLNKTKKLIQDQEDRINKIIVGQMSLDTILVKVEMIANKYNILIKEIKPSEKTIKSNKVFSGSSLILQGQFTQEFDLLIEGIYPDLANFISSLEKIDSLIIIKEIDLKENIKRSDILVESSKNMSPMQLKILIHGKPY